MSRLFVLLQHLVPQHGLSRLVAVLARCRTPWIKNPFIRWFVRRYGVDLSQAATSDIQDFSCFNDFFTRRLRDGARPLADHTGCVLCPADGTISELGAINGDRLLQAKGRHYSLQALLGGDTADAQPFLDGSFITVYLSPRDYHRVHMPLAGKLRGMIHVPGRLFSVNQTTANSVAGLFSRNERVVCFFDTVAGPMVQVMVGAMIVAGIDTVWAGRVAPGSRGRARVDYQQHSPPIFLTRGAEMGLFRLGSTVITLFGPGAVSLDPALKAGDAVRMGEPIGMCS